MINWTEIADLHVIAKLDEILGKWFGTELIFCDYHGKVKSRHTDKDYEARSHLFKLQQSMNLGFEYLNNDIDKVNQFFSESSEKVYVLDSYFQHVKYVTAKVEIDGEYLGAVIAYPFIMDSFTAEESKKLIAQLIESGANKDDAVSAVENLKKLSETELDYVKELVDLVADEVKTFHEEISVREERIQMLNSELGNKFRYHNMIGKSKHMQDIYRLLEKISKTEASVFIHGENGTGKELVAKAIHFGSPRKDGHFLAVNCSAFNDNLLDSELFGHVKGAFTGAIKDKKGLFEQANGGTLFLDEVGDTSLSMQVKLLRVLQEGTFLPVGATVPRKTDVRIIAATNRNLKEMMAKAEFREDLFYRINVINVNIPPLRDRSEDIPLLMDHFLKQRCDEQGHPLKTLSKKCKEKMLDYAWPGNVRELENEIERLVVLAGADKNIIPEFLSARIMEFGARPVSEQMGINTNGSLKVALEELEMIMIKEGLRRCKFNKSKLSKELGISRASLIMKVDKYGLDKRKIAAGE